MTQLKVYEIKVKVFVLKEFSYDRACTITSGFVDRCLVKDEEFLKFHEKNCYKAYSIDMPYKPEEDGVYKKDSVYAIRVRTADRKLMDYLLNNLPDTTTEYMKGLTSSVRVIPRKHIAKIYSLTPVVMKLEEGGYWKSTISFDRYEKLLVANLIKKYNSFMGTKIDEDFDLYNSIEKLNKVPIGVVYKSIKLLGDKFEIVAADNPMAQELMYFAIASGLGGNNSRGLGFVGYKYQ